MSRLTTSRFCKMLTRLSVAVNTLTQWNIESKLNRTKNLYLSRSLGTPGSTVLYDLATKCGIENRVNLLNNFIFFKGPLIFVMLICL